MAKSLFGHPGAGAREPGRGSRTGSKSRTMGWLAAVTLLAVCGLMALYAAPLGAAASAAPSVTTKAASSVTDTSAALNGAANPNRLAATAWFQWGTSTAYGNQTSPVGIGSGHAAVAVSAPVSGLTADTVYHYRVAAANSKGTRYGNDVTFTTPVTGPPPPTYSKVAYLTFDDGPDPLTTPGVVKTLAAMGAHATFFLIGDQVPGNAAIVRSEVQNGNVVGDHTWDHQDMAALTASQQQAEVLQTRTAIYNASGVYPRYFRYPYGSAAAFTEASLAGWGFNTPAVYWSFDNADWNPLCPGAAAILASVEANVFDGATVLLHDVSYCGVAQMSYVGPLIDWLHANGYDVRAISPGVYPAQPAPASAAAATSGRRE